VRKETRELYKEAFRRWDYSQLLMAIEEMAELTYACSKFWRNPVVANAKKLAEEIADVEIMIGQLQVVFECEKAVKKIRRKKLRRLKKLLKKEM